jgi:hypothetical protein
MIGLMTHVRKKEIRKQERKAAVADAKAGKTFRRTTTHVRRAEAARRRADSVRERL